jgi:ELWxxDGT repeat protein
MNLNQSVTIGTNFYFSAFNSIYKTDGTAGGTQLVKNLGSAFSSPNILIPKDNLGNGYLSGTFSGGRFFFIGDDGTNGVEVWQTDGTNLGTTMVQDVYSGANSSYPHFAGIATATNKLVLFAQNNASGVSMYATTATTIPFPVSLTDFTAQLKGTEVAVNWATQNEVTVANYNVQRSITGKDFLTIGKVNAIGSTGQQGYSFTDREPGKASVLYYRLEVVDKDGKISYSKIQTVKVKQSFDFSLVPTRSEAVISLDDINGLVSVKLSDANGRMILQQKQKITSGELIKISTANLSTGMYFVTIEYEGNILTKRLIK